MKNSNLKQRISKIKKKLGADRLEKRERIILLFGGLFVACFLILQLIVFPYLEAREKLASSLKRKENELIDIQLLKQEYSTLKSRQGDIEKRLAKRVVGFSLFSFLEEQASGAEVKGLVTYMKPSTNEIDEGFNESIVEMKIEKVDLEQLVSFLKKIESDEMIVLVQRISIQENSQTSGLLDSVLHIKTFEMNRL